MRAEPLLTREAVRGIDAGLLAAGVPGVLLMENAGRGASAHIHDALGGSLGRAVVLVGPGNNGGDALVVARHLRLGFREATIRVACLVDPGSLRGDAGTMRDALGATDLVLEVARDDEAYLEDLLGHADLVVDGMFGTGLTRPLTGLARTLARAVNARRVRCVAALDLPSGLDADTGAPLGAEGDVVRATLTCTFAARKPGLTTGFGLLASGEVHVVGLGCPLDLEALGPRAWRSWHGPPAPRPADTHKGTAGHVVVIAGSPGKSGAALLAARGAHRAGAGLVTLASRSADGLVASLPETMTRRLPEVSEAIDTVVAESLSRARAVVLGPGLGLDDIARETVRATLAHCVAPLVIDADGLALAAPLLGATRTAAVVLTPHPLELSRILGLGGAAAVNADRFGAARAAAARFGAVVLLKGAGTVVAHPDGRAWALPYADPTLGVGGSGDVLAGAIGARLAEEPDVLRATLEAAHAHGRAGMALRQSRSAVRGALASEIADELGRCLEGRDP